MRIKYAILVAVVLAAAGVAGYVFVTSDYIRAQIENHANAMAGHKTKIGDVFFALGWTSHIRLDDIEVSNTDWGKADHLFKAQQVEFDIRLWPLIHGNLVLPTLILRKPEIYLERNAQDQSNWSPEQSPVASGAVQAVQPQHRHQTPLIGRLEGESMSLQFIGGSALMLRETDKPYPVDLKIAYGDTRLAIKGSVEDPFQSAGLNLQLSLNGPDLSEIFPLLGIPARRHHRTA